MHMHPHAQQHAKIHVHTAHEYARKENKVFLTISFDQKATTKTFTPQRH